MEMIKEQTMPGTGRRQAILGILLDVLPPSIAYFGLRAAGASLESALLTASAVAGMLLVIVAVRTRRFDVFAAFIMAVYGLSFATALMSGDERFLLLRDSFSTGILAIGFLISCLVGKPLVFLAARRATGDANWDMRFATEPGVRKTFTMLTLVWGAGLLTEAIIRIPLVYLLDPDVMVGLSSVLQLVAIAALLVWSVKYVQYRRRTGAQRNPS